MPTGFGCEAGTGGQGECFFGLLQPEPEPVPPLGLVLLPDVRREDRAVDPAAEPHRLAEQHEVLEVEERLVVGAHRVCEPERCLAVLVQRSRCAPA